MSVNQDGILAAGRKFYPTEVEKPRIKRASSFLEKEYGCERIFTAVNKKFYMAVCYDIFGINKIKGKNPEVDAVLNLVHRFEPIERALLEMCILSKMDLQEHLKIGDVLCLQVTVFKNRDIPGAMAFGVLWNQGDDSTKNWKYEYNGIKQDECINI